MLKLVHELMLVRRTIYTSIFTFLAVVATDVATFSTVVLIATLIFGFSFMWQYYLLNRTLKEMPIERRAGAAFLWMLFATAVATLGLHLILSIDWTLPREDILKSLAWRMSILLVAASMFVGGSCSWHSFDRHNSLLPKDRARN